MVHELRAVSELQEKVVVSQVDAAMKNRLDLLLRDCLKLLPCVDPVFFDCVSLDGQWIFTMIDPINGFRGNVLGSEQSLALDRALSDLNRKNVGHINYC